MRYRNQHDIDFDAFRNFSEQLEGLEPDEVAELACEMFFPEQPYSNQNVVDFYEAMKTPGPMPYKLDMSFRTAARFIDADTYMVEGNKLELARVLVKKPRFGKIAFSLSVVNHAESAFIDYVAPIKQEHEWIYNPPIILSENGAKPNTIKNEYMKEFVEHYGAYMEMVYLLTGGDFTKQDEVLGWEPERFLFQGEYLLRKKRIESI